MTIWALIPLISCLTYVVLFGLTLPSIRRRTNRIFAFHVGVAAVWSFTSFMLHLNAFPQQALLWNELLTAALVWTLITYYHFIRAYTNKPAGIGVYLGCVLVLVLAVLCLSGNIVQYAYVVDGVLYHSLGISLYFIGAVCLTFTGAGLYQLIKKYHSSVNPIERNRTLYLMAGWSIIILFGYSNLIPVVAGIPLDHIGSIANALIIAYAISRLHLLDFGFVVRRGLAYFLVIICIGGIYTGAILLGHRLLPDQPIYSVLLLASGLALLLALLARPLRYLIQERIDRFFYRGTYVYRQALLNFNSKMGNIINLNELVDEMLPTISKALRVTQAKLLFEDMSSGDFTTQFTYPKVEGKSSDELRFNLDNSIIAWLEKEASPLNLDQIDNVPQLRGLWQIEREKLITSNLELLCPIKSRSKLVGILALGKKQSGTLYSHEDVELVMSLANQAGIMIENATMLDSLKGQQRQVEQLLAQVVMAQEEERKRISVDLHDSVAQWLVAASYRAQTCSQILSGDGNDVVRSELAGMESTIDRSLKELRRVVVGLRPPALDELGLSHALRQSLEDLQADGLEYEFGEVGTPIRLPSSVEIAVYRVVQEALTNIRKHANASKVALRLQFHDDKVEVEVHDNGQGFDSFRTLNSAISVGHMGLLGMKQRAEMLGGDIKIRTGKEAGTTIVLSLPIQTPIGEG